LDAISADVDGHLVETILQLIEDGMKKNLEILDLKKQNQEWESRVYIAEKNNKNDNRHVQFSFL